MIALVVQSRKRKGREAITYAPIDERDRMRREYFDNKIWKNDTICVNMLRLGREPFFRFCQLFRDRNLLKDTIHLTIEQQVVMFLHTVGHNIRNMVIGANFGRSGEVVSRYFKTVLHAIGELRDDLIRKPSLETQTKIEGNYRWDPYFKAHPEDEQYLNKTITHYKEMVNIAGGSMATGQYAKGSSDPLATEVVNLEEETTKKPTARNEEVAQSTNVGSSGPKPKKAKPNPCAEDKLHATILASSERIAIAIEKSTSSENNAIDGLWESMKVLPGFSLDHLAHYYAYLVDNPRVAMAFKVLEEDQRKVWVSRYVKSTFPEA
ncbi:hypothetical protein CFC21_051306 [Triticum aestivum]|uniref:DUF8040 domain-containing protein n=2 Tax=Triticum aestivum TaxID=4565 RepID=A0A3B6HNC7_WHEAT|nr:hypothetical protein CFC21_051306 [Triticum aestivum]